MKTLIFTQILHLHAPDRRSITAITGQTLSLQHHQLHQASLWESQHGETGKVQQSNISVEPPVMSFSDAVSAAIALISADIYSDLRPSRNRSMTRDMILTLRTPTCAAERRVIAQRARARVCARCCQMVRHWIRAAGPFHSPLNWFHIFPAGLAGEHAVHFAAQRERLKAAVPVPHRVLQ